MNDSLYISNLIGFFVGLIVKENFNDIILNVSKYGALATGSIISIIAFFSGLQILCIGVVGEYVGKTYVEVKERPRYIISENLLEDKNDK